MLGVPPALGALALGRLLESLLVGVRPAEPLVLIAASTILFLVAAVASYVPGRRAASTNPVIALRHE